MKRKFMTSKDMARAVMLAMGAVSAMSTQAATLYGGGATLPAVGYEGGAAALGNITTPPTRLSVNTIDTHSLFGAYKTIFATTVSYCQTGSGTGKRVLGGVLAGGPYQADTACGDFTGTPLGFSAPTGQHDPNFAASDAPLAQSEYSSVVNSWGTAHTAPVQFPVVAGAVGILYNNASISSLTLNETQVCQIFSGQISNWSQLGAPAAAINVIFRSDGSGTTFSLTNHLSAICGSLAALPAGEHYITDQTFTVAYGSIGTLPSFFTGASGNPAVVNAVAATANSISYGEIADAEAHNPSVAHAKVINRNTATAQDPLTNFPATVTVSTTTGQVISGVNATTGQPVLSNVTGGAQTQCLIIAVPSSYADPASGYPIQAVSNLLGYYAGNGTNATVIADLLGAAYNTTIRTLTTDIGASKGLGFLNVGTAIPTVSSGTPSVISNCITS